ncbi:mitochondrial protein C2orf69 homolog [Styela clava]
MLASSYESSFALVAFIILILLLEITLNQSGSTITDAPENDEEFRNFQDIEGLEGRRNSLVYSCPVSSQSYGHVVFFPGDIQDFEKNMKKYDLSVEWINWSYEKMFRILKKRFPNNCLWIVQPSKRNGGIFSLYPNFLPFAVNDDVDYGIPVIPHNASHGGLTHFVKLLSSGQHQTMKFHNTTLNRPIILVGFSKGCIVLNQFLHEVAYMSKKYSVALSEDEDYKSVRKFVAKISELYWLDGGHSGTRGLWVVDSNVLAYLKDGIWMKNIKIYVQVTLWGINDPMQPRYEEELSQFGSQLRNLDVNYNETRWNVSRTLENHFKILNSF